MFNTTTIDTTKKQYPTNKYLSPGHYEVKVNSITPYKAGSGSYQLRFELETPAVTTEGFVPADGHTGQVGTVRTVYISNPEMEQQVGTLIASLADVTGTRDQVDSIKTETYEEYATALQQIVKDKYFMVSISGKKYVNGSTGKVGTELQFSRYKTFATKQDVLDNGVEKVLGKIYIKELPTTDTAKKEEVLF